MQTSRGVVINVHLHGATVRLDDGTLASVPFAELSANRPTYVASLQKRTPLDLALEHSGRHRAAFLTQGGAARLALPARAPDSSATAPSTATESRGRLANGDAPDDADDDDGHDEALDVAGHDEDLADGEIVRTLRLVDGSSPLRGDPLFEHRIAAYLKQTEDWAPTDRPPPDERHETRKKKRAAFFEGRPVKRQPPK